MSDPVTNVEIEDVLSSIRRLVSDGDKARTRDPAPIQADDAPVQNTPETPAETTESKPDKFVLTPAFLVVDNNAPSEEAADVDDRAHEETHENPDEDEWVEEIPEAAAPVPESDAEIEEGPLPLTDMVWDSVNDARKAGLAAVPVDAEVDETATQAPDRSELVATIAELEAAVSNDIEDFEPDPSIKAEPINKGRGRQQHARKKPVGKKWVGKKTGSSHSKQSHYKGPSNNQSRAGNRSRRSAQTAR